MPLLLSLLALVGTSFAIKPHHSGRMSPKGGKRTHLHRVRTRHRRFNSTELARAQTQYLIVGTKDNKVDYTNLCKTKWYNILTWGETADRTEKDCATTQAGVVYGLLTKLNVKEEVIPSKSVPESMQEWVAGYNQEVLDFITGNKDDVVALLMEWILHRPGKPEIHDGVTPLNVNYGKEMQKRWYENYWDLARGVYGWINARPNLLAEATVAKTFADNANVGTKMDNLLKKIHTILTSATADKDNKLKQAYAKHKTLLGTAISAYESFKTPWAGFKWANYYWRGMAGKVPSDFMEIMNDPSGITLNDQKKPSFSDNQRKFYIKAAILHDVATWFRENGGALLHDKAFGTEPELSATIGVTWKGKSPTYEREGRDNNEEHSRPHSAVISDDWETWAAALIGAARVKPSTEETHPAYIFARRYALPMWARHSKTIMHMLWFEKVIGELTDTPISEQEMALTVWSMAVFWRVFYDHTLPLPYHTFHETMDATYNYFADGGNAYSPPIEFGTKKYDPNMLKEIFYYKELTS